jgi:chromosomal replication initiation ATPase DnaA
MITSKTIKKQFDDYYGFDIATRSRKQQYSFARMVYCKLARKYTNESLAQIGKSINRDHATILYCVKEADNVIDFYFDVKRTYNALEELLRKKGSRTLHDKYYEAMQLAIHYRKKYFDIKK